MGTRSRSEEAAGGAQEDEALRHHYALVEYMRALDGEQKRPELWQEHSYCAARRPCGRGGRGCGGDAGGPVRRVGTRRPPRCRQCRPAPPPLDVELVWEPPALPHSDTDDLSDFSDADDRSLAIIGSGSINIDYDDCE